MKPQAKMTKWFRDMEYHADLHSTQLSRKHEGFLYSKGIRYTRTTKMHSKAKAIAALDRMIAAEEKRLAAKHSKN